MATETATRFIAEGPTPTAFVCLGANIIWGAKMEGTVLGLYAQPLDPGPAAFPPPIKRASSAHRVPGRVSWARPLDRSAYGANLAILGPPRR